MIHLVFYDQRKNERREPNIFMADPSTNKKFEDKRNRQAGAESDIN